MQNLNPNITLTAAQANSSAATTAICPGCGTTCNHSPAEMQGFAYDALTEAADAHARDVAACERANDKQRIAELTRLVEELQCSPPMAFAKLSNDKTYRQWMTDIASSSTNHKQRKELVRNLSALIEACAAEQRGGSVTTLGRALLTTNWQSMDSLPAPYEEVRILFDGVIRIARLAHTKTYFQLASFLADVKGQYVVPIEKVKGWQPLVAAPIVSE